LNNTIHLDNTLVNTWAERIQSARKLYGQDSSYVIGMMTVFDWLAHSVEGGAGLHSSLLKQLESGASVVPAAVGPEPRSGSPSAGVSESKPDALAENTWIRGAVKWFNNDKGYGFISTDSEVDVFVHWRDISSWDRSLVQGDEVEFMVTRTAKGFQAINVMKAGGEEGATEPSEENAEESAGYLAEEVREYADEDAQPTEMLTDEPDAEDEDESNAYAV